METIKVMVILTTKQDYPDWIKVIKTIAETKGVWKYVNPAGTRPNTEAITTPVLSVQPTLNSIKPSANAIPTLYSQLDINQLKELWNCQSDYNR
jgi:hypothetical protein